LTDNLVSPAIAVLFIAGAARLIEGSWARPGAYFSFLWAFFVCFSFSAPLWGAPFYPVWSGAVWWMALGTLVFVVGALLGYGVRPRVTPHAATFNVRFPHVGALIAASLLGSALVLTYYRQVYDPLAIVVSPWTQSVLPFHYLGPVLGGLLFATESRRSRRLLALLMLLPPILVTLLYTGRGSLVTAFIYFISVNVALRVRTHKNPLVLFTVKHVALGIVIVVAFVAVAVIAQSLRQLVVPNSTVLQQANIYRAAISDESIGVEKFLEDWEWMQPSLFGAVSAFSGYFEMAWDVPPVADFGSSTFGGIRRWLGIMPEQAFSLEVGGVNTNAFIMFKNLIEDFGLWGSLAFLLLYGWIAGWAYRRVSEGALSPVAILVQFYTNCAVGGGYFFNYNSITAVLVFLFFYLGWIERHQLGGGRLVTVRPLVLARGLKQGLWTS
jgi:hypothetical protein